MIHRILYDCIRPEAVHGHADRALLGHATSQRAACRAGDPWFDTGGHGAISRVGSARSLSERSKDTERGGRAASAAAVVVKGRGRGGRWGSGRESGKAGPRPWEVFLLGDAAWPATSLSLPGLAWAAWALGDEPMTKPSPGRPRPRHGSQGKPRTVSRERVARVAPGITSTTVEASSPQPPLRSRPALGPRPQPRDATPRPRDSSEGCVRRHQRAPRTLSLIQRGRCAWKLSL